jgi:hypothetical protein
VSKEKGATSPGQETCCPSKTNLADFLWVFPSCKTRGEPKEFWLSLACEDHKTPDASYCWKSSKKSKCSLERRAASQELQSERTWE